MAWAFVILGRAKRGRESSELGAAQLRMHKQRAALPPVTVLAWRLTAPRGFGTFAVSLTAHAMDPRCAAAPLRKNDKEANVNATSHTQNKRVALPPVTSLV
jgi:hypothetical protein